MSLFHNSVLLGASGQGGTLQLEKSVRFNKADSAHLSRTMSDGDRGKATISCWLKKCNLHSVTSEYIYLMGVSSECSVYITTNDKLHFDFYHTDGSTWAVIANSDMIFADVSAWYHIVLSIDSSAGTSNADRAKLYVNGAQKTFTFATYGSGTITGDIKHLNQSGQTFQINSRTGQSYYGNFYLANYHYIDGQALDPTYFGEYDTNNVWQPIDASGLTFGTNGFHLFDFANESGIGDDSSGNDNDFTVNNIATTTDTTVWTSYLFTSDSTYDGTSTTVNFQGPTYGTAQAFDGSTSTECISNVGGESYIYFRPPGGFSSPSKVRIYARNVGEFRINGSVVTTSPAAGSSAQWYEVTSTLPSTVTEIAHNGESQVYNARVYAYEIDDEVLVVTGANQDILRDVPTNGTQSDTGAGGEVSGNYCTWNTLAQNNATLSNGNLDCSLSNNIYSKARATIAVTSGKYYWEITYKSGQYGMIGISDASLEGSDISYAAGVLNYYVLTGGLYGDVGGSFSNTSYGSALSADDVLGVALDMDNGNVRFIKNGSDTFGNANTSSLVGKTIMPHLGEGGGATFVTVANFGQRPFAYSAPSGYKALCTTNLPTPTITDGSTAFDVVLYSSDGNARTISGLNMSPDLVWSKRRSSAGRNVLTDSVRGVNKELFPNRTDAERTSTNGLTAFNSDGYTLGTDSGQYGWQANGQTFVNWAWDAGSSTVSNTDGDMTSTVRVNQSAGFSIVKWTSPSGTTPFDVGHGLNTAPSFIITKCMTNASGWYCYHEALDATNPQNKYLQLNTTQGALTSADSWGTSKPNSTTFGDRHLNWAGGDDIIAYCFSPVDNYSAFGSYIGNGNTSNGPFINTGFRPALVIFKRIDTSATASWYIYDYKRLGYNPENSVLYPNTTDAEAASTNIHLLSNGFRLIGAGGDSNATGGSYVYMAWAQNPFSLNGGIAR